MLWERSQNVEIRKNGENGDEDPTKLVKSVNNHFGFSYLFTIYLYVKSITKRGYEHKMVFHVLTD